MVLVSLLEVFLELLHLDRLEPELRSKFKDKDALDEVGDAGGALLVAESDRRANGLRERGGVELELLQRLEQAEARRLFPRRLLRRGALLSLARRLR